jgi:formylglycine-generating enzyme required for sulfatase activity
VVDVSWGDVQAYCGWLGKRSGLPVRLPSEAEWENACRAGSRDEYGFGDDEKKLGDYAWFDANSDGRAHAVRTKRANAWGLHDLHGNVLEWCEDLWHDNYQGAPEDATAWTTGASPRRVFRGGSWCDPAVLCRSANRSRWHPDDRVGNLGFRPAASGH